jgi:hypothetical protein
VPKSIFPIGIDFEMTAFNKRLAHRLASREEVEETKT